MSNERLSIFARLAVFIVAIILLTILAGIVWLCGSFILMKFWIWNGIGIRSVIVAIVILSIILVLAQRDQE